MTSNGTSPKTHRVRVIMNGVTGRMGTNQHLIRSIIAIRKEGGLRCADGDIIIPEPILIGRNHHKLVELAVANGLDPSSVSTDIDAALADDANPNSTTIYFDAQTTGRRVDAVKKALTAGKHVYCEKPTATSSAEAYELYKFAKASGLKHGVVQDKLWLPGFVKLRSLIDSGFFGDILSVKGKSGVGKLTIGDFGYWVFTGMGPVPAQRPSWNYRKEDDGGIITDMVCHWRYVIHNLFGPIKSLTCLGATHIPERKDEQGKVYKATADDACYLTAQLENGVVVNFVSSWVTRPRRDDLLTVQVDGTKGSAVATLRDCVVQHESTTPRPTWNPDVPSTIDHFAAWSRVPDVVATDNAFKVQWEMFLRHVVKDEEFKYNLLEGARGVQLAELALDSWAERRWVDVPVLEA